MGLNILRRILVRLQLLAQRCHKHPQGRLIVFPVPSPDILRNELVGQYLPCVFAQQAEQFILTGRKV